MVICQVFDKLKLVLLFAAQYLTVRVKIMVIFVSYGSLALAFCMCVCVCVCERVMRVS